MSDQAAQLPHAIEANQKLFSFIDNVAIWFSLGVGLLVIMAVYIFWPR